MVAGMWNYHAGYQYSHDSVTGFQYLFTIIPLQNGTIDEFTKTALEAAGITEASLGTLKISTGISMTVYIIEAVVAVMGIAFVINWEKRSSA